MTTTKHTYIIRSKGRFISFVLTLLLAASAITGYAVYRNTQRADAQRPFSMVTSSMARG
nr:hypothetical protein [Maliibacterium massiliense]